MKKNNLEITGNIGKDPKLTFTKTNNKAIASFSLAVSQSRKDGDTWIELKPLWLQVKFFGELAEKVCDTYAKGETVLITGKLAQSEYELNGEIKTSLDLIGNTIEKVERTTSAQFIPAESPSPSNGLPNQSEKAPF